MHLTVVIPFLNEEESVGPLLREVRGVLEGLAVPFEILAVDDGSSDGTAALLDGLSAEWDRLRVVHHARRCGQSAALCSGFAAARGELVATLDGDGQSDPADLPVLLR